MLNKIMLSLLVLQMTCVGWCSEDSHYDEGEFKGFTFGKGYMPRQDQRADYKTDIEPVIKYDEHLGYYFEVEKGSISPGDKKLTILNKSNIEKNKEEIGKSNRASDNSQLENQLITSH